MHQIMADTISIKDSDSRLKGSPEWTTLEPFLNLCFLEWKYFFIISTKNIYVLTQITVYAQYSYTFASSRIKIRRFYSTMNKRKDLCIPYIQPERIIFLSKNHKTTAFRPNCPILNGRGYIWINKYRNDNSEVTKSKS